MTKTAAADDKTQAVYQALAHDSAAKHVAGRAVFTDDIPEPPGTLYAAVGLSDRARARITRLDLDPVRALPGVVAVMAACDVPASNEIGPDHPGDPMFADETVEYWGQSLFAVAALSARTARQAARRAVIDYEDLEPILSIEVARAAGAFVLPSQYLRRGDPKAAIAKAAHHVKGSVRTGGQEHFYLEGQVALAVPQEDGDMLVYSSTQHPMEIQTLVARVLGKPANAVTVEVRRLGGAFGGKESQAALFACVAAVLADRTRRPVKFRADRDDDFILTGKRHDCIIDYDVGFDDSGRIQGIEFVQSLGCGISPDLSGGVGLRAMLHADNCYYLENVAIATHYCRTNTVSNTAFRGYGGPQGMMGIEYVLDDIARYLGLDPLAVRKRNFYGRRERNVTPYHMTVEDNIIDEVVAKLERSASYQARRRAIVDFNQRNAVLVKGIAFVPVKFGISYIARFLNQAGALVHIYTDGSVHLNHGGVEMGQGLFIKVAQVVAEVFGIDIERVKITAATTGKVPNATATSGSTGSDLNGAAARAAAKTLRRRLADCAARKWGVPIRDIVFRDNIVSAGNHRVSFAELVNMAYLERVSLSATGYYKTPKIDFDLAKKRGRPFYYFSYGAAVSEVVVDTLTGEYKVQRVDIVQDCGRSLNPAIDLGQVEGGFVQGMGWVTTEELFWDEAGRLMTHAPSTYKIPVCSDLPEDFRVTLLANRANKENTVYRSKGVGEPPLMLAISVFLALKDAVANACGPAARPHLDAPATPERILLAIDDGRNGGAGGNARPTRRSRKPRTRIGAAVP